MSKGFCPYLYCKRTGKCLYPERSKELNCPRKINNMPYDYTDEQILKAAIAAHECNRAFCVSIGDNTQVPWEWAESWQKESAINSVKGVINGSSPEQLHIDWCSQKYVGGWNYGPVKDPAKKQHPCLVPYNDLPQEQQAKDDVFVAVVKAVLEALKTKEVQV